MGSNADVIKHSEIIAFHHSPFIGSNIKPYSTIPAKHLSASKNLNIWLTGEKRRRPSISDSVAFEPEPACQFHQHDARWRHVMILWSVTPQNLKSIIAFFARNILCFLLLWDMGKPWMRVSWLIAGTKIVSKRNGSISSIPYGNWGREHVGGVKRAQCVDRKDRRQQHSYTSCDLVTPRHVMQLPCCRKLLTACGFLPILNQRSSKKNHVDYHEG